MIKQIIRPLLAAILIGGAILLAACEEEDLSTFESMFGPSQYGQADAIISAVNGDTITVGMFQERVRFIRWLTAQQVIEYYHQQGQNWGTVGQYVYQLDDHVSFGGQVLDAMEEEILIAQEAQARGIAVDATEVDRRMDEYLTTYNAEWETSFQEVAQQAGVHPDILRELLYFDLLREALIADMAADLPREELQVNTRHIFLAFDPGGNLWPDTPPTEEQKAAALGRSKDVLRALLDGESFAVLAQIYSDDFNPSTGGGSARNGGELGWANPDLYVENFREVVLNAVPGEIVGPVETEFGYHIVQVHAREVRPLTEDEIQQRAQQSFRDLLGEAKAAAQIWRADAWTDVVPDDPTLEELFEGVLG